MDGQDRETAGKRKTKNSTSLAEGEKNLAQTKKESEKQAKKEQRLKEKEERVLKQVLVLSRLEARMNGSLAISEQEAKRKEEVAHLLDVQTATSTESSQLLLFGTVASSSTYSSNESGEDHKRESSDSLSALPDPDGSSDVATSNEFIDAFPEEPPQQRISSEMSDAERQRHLNELGTYNSNSIRQ